MTANDNEKQAFDMLMSAVTAHTGIKNYQSFFDYEQRVDAAHRMAKQAQENGKKSRKKLPKSKKQNLKG